MKTNDFTQAEWRRKIEELLRKFEKGEEFYREDALFHNNIQMLLMGADPYQIIEQLIRMNRDLRKMFQKYIEKFPSGALLIEDTDIIKSMDQKELPNNIVQFIDWIGENYVKLHGGWVHKYTSQIKPKMFTTEELYKFYKENINFIK